MADHDVIVVGGGLAGLACAVALGEHGLRTLVLERGDAFGGRARSCTDPTTGDRIDLGPHILLSEYRNMLRLLERLGTHGQVAWQGRKFIILVDPPRPVTLCMYPLPAPLHFLPGLLTVPQLSLRDVASNTRLMWHVMRLHRAEVLRLDAQDAESVVRRLGVSERFIDWYWRTVAMSIMNVPLAECSAGALFAFFRHMIGVSGYQVGLPGEGLGDLFVPPAVRRIEADGGAVRLQADVVRIDADPEGFTGVTLADGSAARARWCVAAVPPSELRSLLEASAAPDDSMLSDLAGLAPSPYISTYLWFPRKLTHERFWAKVWSPDALHYDFYDLSNIRPDWQARGSVIACNLIYSDRAAHLTDEAIVAAAQRELSDFLPEAATERVVHARVHRIPMAIPAPHPGSEQRRPQTVTPVRGFFLAGDWTHTGLPCSMESAVRSGWLAAEQVLAAAGRPAALVSPLPQMQGLVRLVGGAAPVE